MALVITGNKVSMYKQVAQSLMQRVRTGEYHSSDPLPSVRTLSNEFGVSLNVVQRAIRCLEQDGIVKTHPGKALLVAQNEDCEKAAFIFGFIHPYGTSFGFSRNVLGFVDQAFENRSNFAIVRSSRDNPTRERQVAEHLIANGVKGLILWPASDNPNEKYFTKLAQTVPVILVDRLWTGCRMPAVVHDCFGCGREIGEHLLGKLKKKRLLVLMDDLRISTYDELIQGIRQSAREMKRLNDITIVQLHMTKLFEDLNNAVFTEIPFFAGYVDRLLKEGGYDSLFCSQDEFIDYALVETGLMDKFPNVQLATFKGTDGNSRTRKYHSLGCLEWQYDSGKMVSLAADAVQRWLLSHQAPKEIVRLKIQLFTRPSIKAQNESI